MIVKKSLLSSILNQNCPRCRSEKMFMDSVYSKRFNQMHKSCPKCSQEFELEPGFFMGAMYVSYAIQVVMIALVVVLTEVFTSGKRISWYLSWVIVMIVSTFPLVFRLSRSIWIHLFVRYRDGLKSETILRKV